MRQAPRQPNASEQILQLLRDYESRNITFIEPDHSWPIVWEKAKGVQVWDAEGKEYVDLTAAFGVAAAGHSNPRVVKAGQRQMARLLHAMGDVHPHAGKAELARELSRMTFERWGEEPIKGARKEAPRRGTRPTGAEASKKSIKDSIKVRGGKTIFCNSGFEAVEAGLKTAMLATGKKGVIAFSGAYHGLGYGALNATHRDYFRSPFLEQLGQFAQFVSFPAKEADIERVERDIRRIFKRTPVGAVLVEPVQGRGGINVPPHSFLPLLRRLCEEHQALLILDEVFTGFGRTGRWFACEHTQTVPDLICLGKALSGGFPISACVGRADIMDAAWPETPGEALHTSTFLGHPVGCAMALAQIQEIAGKKLVEASAQRGAELLTALRGIRPDSLQASARGLGLMAGLELRLPNGRPATTEALSAIKIMLRRGYILLPEGEHGNIISFTPPLSIPTKVLLETIAVLEEVILGA